jgi:hypothetical protein
VSPASNGSVVVYPSATTAYHLTLAGAPGPTTTVPTTVVVDPLPTATLSISPSAILIGDAANLSWSTANATSASITDNIQLGMQASPLSSGSVAVTPNSSRTYTITANGALGSTVTQQAPLTVYSRPTGALTANPSGIAPGGSSTLTWGTANTSSASISGVGTVSPVSSGSVTVSPSETTTYTLTMYGALGSTETFSTTVTVTPVNYPPVANADVFEITGDLKQAFGVCFDPRDNDTDANNDSLTITSITNPVPGVGTISYSGSGICIDGKVLQNKTSTMTYTISDGRGGQATGTITIIITVNE